MQTQQLYDNQEQREQALQRLAAIDPAANVHRDQNGKHTIIQYGPDGVIATVQPGPDGSAIVKIDEEVDGVVESTVYEITANPEEPENVIVTEIDSSDNTSVVFPDKSEIMSLDDYFTQVNQKIEQYVVSHNLLKYWIPLTQSSSVSDQAPASSVVSPPVEMPQSFDDETLSKYTIDQIKQLLEICLNENKLQEALIIARHALNRLDEIIMENNSAAHKELAEYVTALKTLADALNISYETLTAENIDIPEGVEQNAVQELIARANAKIENSIKSFVAVLSSHLPGLTEPAPEAIRVQAAQRLVEEIQTKVETNIQFSRAIVDTKAVSAVLMSVIVAPDFLAGQSEAVRKNLDILLPLISREVQRIIMAKMRRIILENLDEKTRNELYGKELNIELISRLTPFARMVFLGEIVDYVEEIFGVPSYEPLLVSQTPVVANKSIFRAVVIAAVEDYEQSVINDSDPATRDTNKELVEILSLAAMISDFDDLPEDQKTQVLTRLIAMYSIDTLLNRYRRLLPSGLVKALEEEKRKSEAQPVQMSSSVR